MSVFEQNINQAAADGQLYPGSDFWEDWVKKYCHWENKSPQLEMNEDTLNFKGLVYCDFSNDILSPEAYFGKKLKLQFDGTQINFDGLRRKLDNELFESLDSKFINIYNAPAIENITVSSDVYTIIRGTQAFENVHFGKEGYICINSDCIPDFINCSGSTRLDFQIVVQGCSIDSLPSIWKYLLHVAMQDEKYQNNTNTSTIGSFNDNRVKTIQDVLGDIPRAHNISVMFPDQRISFRFSTDKYQPCLSPSMRDGYQIVLFFLPSDRSNNE